MHGLVLGIKPRTAETSPSPSAFRPHPTSISTQWSKLKVNPEGESFGICICILPSPKKIPHICVFRDPGETVSEVHAAYSMSLQARGARAVLQLYPENSEQVSILLLGVQVKEGGL